MMCAWESLRGILPAKFRNDVDRLGKDSLQELHLRVNAPPELVTKDRILWLTEPVTKEDIRFCINMASKYSPWASATIAYGYLTIPGGHRIGLCGDVIMQDGVPVGIREANSLHIRIARDISGLVGHRVQDWGSVLILGPPGWGKTTLLREICRRIAENETVAVVDERGELYPSQFRRGKRMDVLTGCPKAYGINMVLRSMGAACIAVDEITAQEDARTLLHAAGCGVRLLATAHGRYATDLKKREVYRPLIDNHVFQTLITMRKDKTYNVERMVI